METQEIQREQIAIQLDYKPEVKLVSMTSRYVRDFCDRVLADQDATSRVALAAHELMENTVKYSSDGVGHMRVAVAERDGQSIVCILTRNRTDPVQLAELQRVLDEIGRCPDPISLYYEVIVKGAERSEGSGLGLARIRAEGEMDLSYAVDGDEVTVFAQAPVVLKETQ